MALYGVVVEPVVRVVDDSVAALEEAGVIDVGVRTGAAEEAVGQPRLSSE